MIDDWPGLGEALLKAGLSEVAHPTLELSLSEDTTKNQVTEAVQKELPSKRPLPKRRTLLSRCDGDMAAQTSASGRWTCLWTAWESRAA